MEGSPKATAVCRRRAIGLATLRGRHPEGPAAQGAACMSPLVSVDGRRRIADRGNGLSRQRALHGFVLCFPLLAPFLLNGRLPSRVSRPHALPVSASCITVCGFSLSNKHIVVAGGPQPLAQWIVIASSLAAERGSCRSCSQCPSLPRVGSPS